MIAGLALSLALAAPVSAVSQVPVVHGPEALLDAIAARKHPTLVHFWALWCGTCLDEVKEIQRLTEGATALGVDVVFVSLDPQRKAAAVGKYLRDNGLLASPLAWAVLLDAPDPGPVAAKFDRRWQGDLPATFFRLESGAITAAHLGATPVDVVLKEIQVQRGLTPPKPSEPTP